MKSRLEQRGRAANKAEGFQLLFERNPLPMWVYDSETLRFVLVNQAAVARYGYTREEFLGMTIKDIRPADEVPRLLEFLKNAGDTRVGGSGGWHHVAKNGQLMDVRLTAQALEFEGRPCRLVVAEDITDVRRAEAELTLSEARFRTIFENALFGIAIVDPDGNLEIVNEAACRFLGRSLTELLGLHYSALVRGADLVATEQLHRRLLAGEVDRHSMDRRFVREDGSVVWGRLSISAIRDETGRLAHTMVACEDVTWRREAEEAMRAGMEFQETLMDSLPVLISYVDREERFVKVNRRYEEWFGVSKAEIVGRKMVELLSADAYEECRPYFLAALGGSPSHLTRKSEDARGESHWVEINYVPRTGPDGDVAGFFTLVSDVSRLKTTEEELRLLSLHLERRIAERTDEVRDLYNNAPCGYHSLAVDGTIVRINDTELRWLGRTREEVVGKLRLPDLLTAEGKAQFAATYPEFVKTGEARDLEYVLVRSDGTTLPVLLSASAVFDRMGRFVMSRATLHDMTHRKQLEVEHARLAAIVESSEDAIYSCTPEGSITTWNKGAERIFGYKAVEIIGRPVTVLVLPGREREIYENMRLVLRGERTLTSETVRLAKDGRFLDISRSVSPLRDANGNITGVSVIARDISERKRMEREILEIADREKQRIGQDLHDDLCQTLVGVSLLSNMLADSLKRQGSQDAEDARGIKGMVQEAVSTARALAKGLAPVDVSEDGFMNAIRRIVDTTRELFKIECDLVCGQPVVFEDLNAGCHLLRIVQEAVHNAVKHAKCRRIIVAFDFLDGYLRVSVTDDGIGMSAAGSGGTGLGRQTMTSRTNVLGGRISFLEADGRGTSVVCEIPSNRGFFERQGRQS